MILRESQTAEFKETWSDDCLKTVCAFANANGGALYIGVNDDGAAVGVKDIKRLMETLPNKVINVLGITADVVTVEENEVPFVKIIVPKSNTAVSLGGKFYTRSGSTTQEVRGGELQNLLLSANNMTWDEAGVDNVGYEDIDAETVSAFVAQATKFNRLPLGTDSGDINQLFQNLELLTGDGKLTRAAVLLFGKRPTRYFRCAMFQIGRFKGTDSTALIVQDRIEANLFNMFNEVINHLKSKYLISPISYVGMQRVETLEIPDKAIREAVLNAIIHKDYTSLSSITLSVYDPTVEIWNAGELTRLDVKDLGKKHLSYRRNPLIANMFYRAGYIEAWGRGTLMIIDETTKSGLPKPQFKIRQGGLEITFKRNWKRLVEKEKSNKSVLDNDENIGSSIGSSIGSNIGSRLTRNRQLIIENIAKTPSISASELAEIIGISKRNVEMNIGKLKKLGIIERIGTTSTTNGRWVLKKPLAEKIITP